ncbi:adenylate isopentenyltransferase-like [Apium graveolens]|uniref:adenylate isopentenyltransferase-like n=1 Tax=Apium graveolens TaxID=4045 RepID=UPI003D7A9C62
MPYTTMLQHSPPLPSRRHPKVLVILGATGAGKSKLSVDVASTFFPNSEIINSDKIQLYRGLHITTNKMTLSQQLGVTHHLLGQFDPVKSMSPSEFRSLGSTIISGILARRRLPIIVGGSNSLIYALLVKRFDPDSDVFNGSKPDPVSSELRYNCCFIWVDVFLPVLNEYLNQRVDSMLDSGMVDELDEFYHSPEFNSVSETGLKKAIGVPEFKKYLTNDCTKYEEDLYEEAVRNVKENTCQLAKRQMGKIQRLREGKWDLRRVDATTAFKAAMGLDSEKAAKIWGRQVVETSVKIMNRFLKDE